MPTDCADLLSVHVVSPDAGLRTGVVGMLDGAAVVVVAADPDVVLVRARTIEQALPFAAARSVVMVDSFSRAGALRALRAGVSTMLHSARTTPAQLVAALHAVRDGEGRLPHDVLVRVLGGGADRDQPAAPQPRLTARQVAVLRLMADGLGNADIARALSCSEHTVKNVIYELTARLHARNRAHAVAAAVRFGLI
jgi:DNA-binding NarL/FixJ family response regulator